MRAMKDLKVHNIIRTFFGKRFSESVQMKFQWWMLNAAPESQTGQAMEDLWEESSAACDSHTLSDLQRLREAIGNVPAAKQRPLWQRFLLRGAAAAVLVALSAGATYYITKEYLLARPGSHDFVQLTVPNGETRELLLDDHTMVTINAGSTLVYPRHFSSDTRTVFLTGEANFQVHEDASRPFIVKTQCFSVQALGTYFGVNAYATDDVHQAILQEGKVKVSLHGQSGEDSGRSYILYPDQSLEYSKSGGHVHIDKQVDAERLLSWNQGYLVFRKADFSQILESIERRYGVRILCDNISKMNGSYYVKFRPTESLHDVLNVLNNLSTHFKYKQVGDTVYIYPI